MGDIMGAFNNAVGFTEDPATVQGSAILLQMTAANQANQLQQQRWEEAQANSRPWLSAGQGAVNQLAAGLSPNGQFSTVPQFKFDANQMAKDPGYQFRMQQGIDAIKAGGAAAGNLGSGNMGVALMDYGQNLASNEYQNAFSRYLTEYNTNLNAQNTLYNRLAGVAGTGQTAANQIANAGQNFANQFGANLTNAANASGVGAYNAALNSQNRMVSAGNQLGNMLGNYFANQYAQDAWNYNNAGSLYGGQWRGDAATQGYYDASGGDNFNNMDTVDLSMY